MLKANERRQKILEILCVRRQETMENLAQEFNVTIRTIRNDIEELTLAHPIETVRGRYGGGVRVADGYYLGRKYLKPNQQELLKRLSENLTGEDLATMNSILSEFALTKRAEKGKNGTVKSPSNRNHKLYCIRLDRQFFKICFISKRILMMPQNNMLQIRKRIMKSDILFSSFFLFL